MRATCANCRQPIVDKWKVVEKPGEVYGICGADECTAWATHNGMRVVMRSPEPKPLTRREAYYKRLTGFREAPEPTAPAKVKRHDGPGWRWICAGCGSAATGEAARRVNSKWYCADCA